ncbi:AbiH family protein [Lysinibacillus sphaericus]
MDLIIIGNGFDIAHGLKTRYSDFLNYLLKLEKSH